MSNIGQNKNENIGFTVINIPEYGQLKGRIHKNNVGSAYFITQNPDGSPLTFAIQPNSNKTVNFINMNKLPLLSNNMFQMNNIHQNLTKVK